MKKKISNELAKRISFSVMKFRMSFSKAYMKVRRVIICFYSILMMNKFFRGEISFNHSFHNKAMFKNISVRISVWVFRHFNRKITVSKDFSSFPIPISFSFRPKIDNFIFARLRTGRIFKLFMFFNRSITNDTFCFNHNYMDTMKTEVCQV